jgi:hypothetical protein
LAGSSREEVRAAQIIQRRVDASRSA